MGTVFAALTLVALFASVMLDRRFVRRFDQYAERRRAGGSRSLWFKRIGYAPNDYSQQNQIRTVIQQGIGLVGLAAIGSTWGFGYSGRFRLAGGWEWWVGGTAVLYLAYVAWARPWSASYRERQANAAQPTLSPETQAWLAGGPLPPTPDHSTQPDRADAD